MNTQDLNNAGDDNSKMNGAAALDTTTAKDATMEQITSAATKAKKNDKGLSTLSFWLQSAGYTVLFIVFCVLLGMACRYGLTYVAELNLSATALQAANIGMQVVNYLCSFGAALLYATKVGKLVARRVVTEFNENLTGQAAAA